MPSLHFHCQFDRRPFLLLLPPQEDYEDTCIVFTSHADTLQIMQCHVAGVDERLFSQVGSCLYNRKAKRHATCIVIGLYTSSRIVDAVHCHPIPTFASGLPITFNQNVYLSTCSLYRRVKYVQYRFRNGEVRSLLQGPSTMPPPHPLSIC